jgi:hypothetical protein
MATIIPDGPERDRMLEGLARVKSRLRAPSGDQDGRRPAERAASIILAILKQARASGVSN